MPTYWRFSRAKNICFRSRAAWKVSAIVTPFEQQGYFGAANG